MFLRPHSLLAVALAAVLLALAGCGKSDQEKAQDNACNAVNSIKTQVNELSGYTPSTVTKAKVQENVAQIRDNLSELKQTLPDVSADLKSQLQSATDAFSQSLSSIVNTVLQSTSISEAKQQVVAAADTLAASYKKAFGSVSC